MTDTDLIEAMRHAYHASKPRWDDQQRASMHTGMEAAYDLLSTRHALRRRWTRTLITKAAACLARISTRSRTPAR